MNWEVPTMRSKTSSSNGSLFRRCLKRYWPLTFVLFVITALWIDVPLAQQLSYTAQNATDSVSMPGVVMMHLCGAASDAPIFAALFALAAAMAVFEHTYSPKLTGLFASLPVRRETLFWSHWLAGLWMLLSVGLVAALAVLPVSAVYSAVNLKAVLLWLGVWTLDCLAFYGIAVFCVMLTGHVLVIPALYALINFAGSALNLMLGGLVANYTYGVSGLSSELDWLHTLSPFVRLVTEVGPRYGSGSYNTISDAVSGLEGWGWAIGYAIVGLILTVCALLLFMRRQNECAQETTAFPVLKPILKYTVTGFFALGIPFAVLFFFGGFRFYSGAADGKFFAAHLALSLVGAVIGYFVSEMIIRKSLGAFSGKGLVKALIVGLLACALVCAFRFDAFGIAKRVPAAADVQTAQLEIGGQRYALDETDEIEAAIALQREILAQHAESGTAAVYDGPGAYCHLSYLLRDGSVLTRQYPLPAGPGLDTLEDMLNREPLRSANELVTPPVPVDAAHIDRIWIDLNTGATVELYGEEAAAFYRDAVLPDIAEGHYGKVVLPFDDDDYSHTHYDVRIGVGLKIDDRMDFQSLVYEPTVETTHTNAWLESFGVTLTPIADQSDG